jgi:hypothetical protein
MILSKATITLYFSTKKGINLELVAMVKGSTKSYKAMVSLLGSKPADLLALSARTTYQDLHHGYRDLTGNEVDLNT